MRKSFYCCRIRRSEGAGMAFGLLPDCYHGVPKIHPVHLDGLCPGSWASACVIAASFVESRRS